MIHVVTGGSGSGKSAYAEEWLTQYVRGREPDEDERGECAALLYLATMRPYTEETKKKIARHQRMRAGRGFVTAECYKGLKDLAVPENTGILLECVSNLAANELYREDGEMEDWRKTLEDITESIRYLAGQTDCLVIVTNEVDSDINGYSEETECYRKLMGRVNQRIAALADRVTEVVYGIPVLIKDDKKIME